MHTPGDMHVQWGGGRFHVIMVQVICMDKVSTISKTHGEERRGKQKNWRTERERGGGGGRRKRERRVIYLPACSSYS